MYDSNIAPPNDPINKMPLAALIRNLILDPLCRIQDDATNRRRLNDQEAQSTPPGKRIEWRKIVARRERDHHVLSVKLYPNRLVVRMYRGLRISGSIFIRIHRTVTSTLWLSTLVLFSHTALMIVSRLNTRPRWSMRNSKILNSVLVIGTSRS